MPKNMFTKNVKVSNPFIQQGCIQLFKNDKDIYIISILNDTIKI